MFNIKDFFNKTKNKHREFFVIYSSIKKAIDENTGGDISINSIKIQKDSSIVILKDINSSFRSQIFIKKQKIIDEVNKIQKYLIITNII